MKKNKLILSFVLIVAIAAGFFVMFKLMVPQTIPKPPDPVYKINVDEKRQFTIPKGYPVQVVPIIQGGKILASSKREDSEKNVYYSVLISLDKSFAEVVSFYQTAFKDVKGVKKSGPDKYIFFSGFKGNEAFTVSMTPGEVNQKKKVILTILIRPKTSVPK